MPRQILPGLHYIQWVPGDKTPKRDYKKFVFPELYIAANEIPDDRWNDWEWLQQLEDKDLYHRRLMRGTMEQLLYNGIISMMNNGWNSIDDLNRTAFENSLLELMRPQKDIMLNLAVECMIRRLAAVQPHGHYVGK